MRKTFSARSPKMYELTVIKVFAGYDVDIGVSTKNFAKKTFNISTIYTGFLHP